MYLVFIHRGRVRQRPISVHELYSHAYIKHNPHHQPPAHRRRVHHSSNRPDRRQCADSRRHAGALRHGGEDTRGHQGRKEHKSAERQLLCGDRSERLGQGSKKGKGNPRGVRGLPLKLTKASVETFQECFYLSVWLPIRRYCSLILQF